MQFKYLTFFSSMISTNHDKVEGFQPIKKSLYPLLVLYCKISFDLSIYVCCICLVIFQIFPLKVNGHMNGMGFGPELRLPDGKRLAYRYEYLLLKMTKCSYIRVTQKLIKTEKNTLTI